jgi:hypothetical protein
LLLVKNESPHIFIVSARRVTVPDSAGSPLKQSLKNPIEVCWHNYVEPEWGRINVRDVTLSEVRNSGHAHQVDTPGRH